MNKKFFTLLAASLMMGTSAYAQCPSTTETPASSIVSGEYYYLRHTDDGATDITIDLNDDDYFAVTKVAGKDSVVCVAPGATLEAKGDSAIWIITKSDDKYYQFQNKATGSYLDLTVVAGVSADKFGWNFEATAPGTPAKLGYIYNYQNYQVQTQGTSSAVEMEKTDDNGVNVYATIPGWKRMTAAELNAMYSDWFKLTDNSATSQTEQAQDSHKAIESKFHAEGVNGNDSDVWYYLNVYGSKEYLNVDTVYYKRIGLLDSTQKLGGHVLTLDTLNKNSALSKKGLASYKFSIWKNVKDSLAIQVLGVPVISASSDNFSSMNSKNASVVAAPESAWITLSSYDAGYNETALTAAQGCFSENMPNPSITLVQGKGKQVDAGYYYIYKGLTQDSAKVAVLDNDMNLEDFEWIKNLEDKSLVPAAQWYVPETSYYPYIFNREATKPLVDNSAKSVKFYEVLDADGNVVENAYEVVGAAGIDTITMIKFDSKDEYLGYKRFGEDAEEADVTEVYLQFNTEIMGGNDLAYVLATPYKTDSLLKVQVVDKEKAAAYKVMPVDTFSIGRDILRAISYKLYYVEGNDTLYVDGYSDALNRVRHTKEASKADSYLMRATYEEGKYQILTVNEVVPAPNTGILVKAEDRIDLTAAATAQPVINSRYVLDQVSVSATTAEVYNQVTDLNKMNGLWSFIDVVIPEYLSLEPGHYRVASTENTSLAITANADNKNAILKAEQDKPGYEADWFKLWVDTVDTNVVRPTFLIGTAQQGIVSDSLKAVGYMAYLKNSGAFATPANDVLAANDSVSFAPALRVGSDSLQINDTTKIALAANPEYTVALRKVEGTEGNVAYVEYRDGSDYGYLAQSNGVLYYTTGNLRTALNNALTFEFEKAEKAPTANETIAAEGVTVIAGEGNVTINGAAGKKVVVSNILGQVVANTVLTSDNATIAAPAGVVVVAVEGKVAVKAIVK